MVSGKAKEEVILDQRQFLRGAASQKLKNV